MNGPWPSLTAGPPRTEDPRLARRWNPLPGDPPELKQWLAAQDAAENGRTPGDVMPEDWPQEVPR